MDEWQWHRGSLEFAECPWDWISCSDLRQLPASSSCQWTALEYFYIWCCQSRNLLRQELILCTNYLTQSKFWCRLHSSHLKDDCCKTSLSQVTFKFFSMDSIEQQTQATDPQILGTKGSTIMKGSGIVWLNVIFSNQLSGGCGIAISMRCICPAQHPNWVKRSPRSLKISIGLWHCSCKMLLLDLYIQVNKLNCKNSWCCSMVGWSRYESLRRVLVALGVLVVFGVFVALRLLVIGIGGCGESWSHECWWLSRIRLMDRHVYFTTFVVII